MTSPSSKTAPLDPAPLRSAWAEHLGEEAEFWRGWLQTRGDRWTENFKARLDPGAPLQEHLRDAIAAAPGATVKILDVGAGPLTIVGKVWEGRILEISAVDPLAEDYDRAMNQAGVVPLVRTRKGEAERLTESYDAGTFDLVYARNCLDHAYDPLCAIKQMVLVAKDNRCAVLEHFPDEAQAQKYQGLHRWNFRIEDGRFVIWRPGLRIDVQAELAEIAEVVTHPLPGLVRVTLRKRLSEPRRPDHSAPQRDVGNPASGVRAVDTLPSQARLGGSMVEPASTTMTTSGTKEPAPDPAASRSVWAGHLGEEVGFWRQWIQTKGARWEEDFKRRQDPAMPLQSHIRELIAAPPGSKVKILDVGAGPLTALGKVWEERSLDITAVDPLAEEYAQAMHESGVVPLVRTRKGEAERLTELFKPGTFDFVYALNCLDHSYNPLEAIRQMVLVSKEGCCAQLEHYADEAERQKYHGLHRWNFRVEDGRFVIWQPDLKIDVEKELGSLAEITARPSQGWVMVTLRKRRA